MKRITSQRYGFWNQSALQKLSIEFDDCIVNGDLHDLILPGVYLSQELFDKMIKCIEHSPNLKTFNYSKVHLKPEYLNRLLEVLETSEIQTIEMNDCNLQIESFESLTSLIIDSMSLRRLNLSFGSASFLPPSLQEEFMSAILKSSALEEVIVENRVLLNDKVKTHLATNKIKNINKDKNEKYHENCEEYSSCDEELLEEVIGSSSRRCKI